MDVGVGLLNQSQTFMNIAVQAATRSTCDRKHVGAVIVRDRSILSTGYNGSIRGMLLNARPLTVSYIVDNAASAGALISIACDSIYMKESATIGAVTVVNQTG